MLRNYETLQLQRVSANHEEQGLKNETDYLLSSAVTGGKAYEGNPEGICQRMPYDILPGFVALAPNRKTKCVRSCKEASAVLSTMFA